MLKQRISLLLRAPVRARRMFDITPISGIIDSVITNAANWQATKSTNQANRAIAMDTNNMNYKINKENNDFNRRMAIEMFNLENAYNTPKAQAERLREAGFNPAVAMTEGNVMGQSIANAATPQSSGLPNMIAPTMQTPHFSFTMADSIAKLAEANKTMKEVSGYDKKLDAEVRSLLSQASKADEETRYQKLLNDVESWNLPKRKEQELTNLVQDFYLAVAREDLTKAEKLSTDLDNKLKDENIKILKEQHPYIVSKTKEEVNLLKEKQQTEKSSQESNRASARASESSASYYDALKQTEDDLRAGKHKELQEAIEDRRYNRALSLLESYMKQHGYNTPIWNLAGNFADAMSRMLRNTFNMSEPVINFMDWFEKNVTHPSDDYRNTKW